MNTAENRGCDASEEKKYIKKTNKQQTTVKFCGVIFFFFSQTSVDLMLRGGSGYGQL